MHHGGDTGGSSCTSRHGAGGPAHLEVPHGSDFRIHPRQLQNSTSWLFGVDPFPSFGDVFFMGSTRCCLPQS
jgi:hypothetical protein